MKIRTTNAKKPTGYLVYSGPSLLDGKPIIVIAIIKSSNEKTGNMIQTYILREDIAPIIAAKLGDDISICGDCKHRPILGGACYVNIGQGVRSVWAAYKRGNYPASIETAAAAAENRIVRLGTYGDPAAVPAHIWETLLTRAAGHTGYSHQWNNASLPQAHRDAIGALCMASADTEAERAEALRMGLRTFRVRLETMPILENEFICPASAEAGRRKLCAECKACDGSKRGTSKASPVIIAHGSKASRFSRVINIRSM